MKNIIERIVGGAKIARYLPKAVSTRLAVAALAALAAGGAWAAVKPLAVWNGDFPTSGTSTRGIYTLDLNGNTSSGGAITMAASGGGVRVMGSTPKLPFGMVASFTGITGTGSRMLATGYLGANNTDYTKAGLYDANNYFAVWAANNTSAGTDTTHTWDTSSLHYFGYSMANASYDNKGTYTYYDGTVCAYAAAQFTSSGYLGVNVGGQYNSNSYKASNTSVKYIAILNSSKTSDISAWSLTNMTSAETFTDGGEISSATDYTTTGINLNGGTVTVSGEITAAAIFVQADTTLNMVPGTDKLVSTGPVYVADGVTLIINTTANPSDYVEGTALSKDLITGTLYVSDSIVKAGTLAAVSAGRTAISVDTTNNKVSWAYTPMPVWNNGAWVNANAPDSSTTEIAIDSSSGATFNAGGSYSAVYVIGTGTLAIGANGLTATTLDVASGASINMENMTATTITGAGTVIYDGTTPTSTIDASWIGTVWVKNILQSSNVQLLPNSWGNSSSVLRFTNVSGWLANDTISVVPVELVDDGNNAAFTLHYTTAPTTTLTFNEFRGSGTFATTAADSTWPAVTHKVLKWNSFTGSLNIDRGRFVFGSGTFSQWRCICVSANQSVEVASGATWTGSTGFVVDSGATLTATGTLAYGGLDGNAVSGSGTVVFDGKTPNTGTGWWTTSGWTGTVWVKNINPISDDVRANYTQFSPNDYGWTGSTLKVTGIKGFISGGTSGFTINPKLELEDGTAGYGLWLSDGYGFNSDDGNYSVLTELKGTGSLIGSGNGDNVMLMVSKWSDFAGTLSLTNKVVVFGTTKPTKATINNGGYIIVDAGQTATISSTKTWYAKQKIIVNGTLSATDKDRWDSTVLVNDDGVLELTSTSDTNESSSGSNKDYSSVTGTGTLKYTSSSGWRTFPNDDAKMPATTLTLQVEVANSLIITKGDATNPTTIGSLSGTKNIRSDWEQVTGASTARLLNINQTKDTTWSGHTANGDRIDTITVSGGGTLTLAASENGNADKLAVATTGSVNLSGLWNGDTTVSGTFGGTGSLTGNLTFNAGATFKAFSTDSDGLSVSGAVTFPITDGESVTVDLTGVTLDPDGTTLITANSINSVSKLASTRGVLIQESNVLKAYPVASLTKADGSSVPYDSISEAMGGAYLNPTYQYVTVYAASPTEVTLLLETTKLKVVGDSSLVTIVVRSAEYSYSAGSPVEGVTTYTLTANPTTYTWSHSDSSYAWSSQWNWRFGDNVQAERYPMAGDSVVFPDGAAVTLDANADCAAITVNGAVAIGGDYGLNVSGNVTGGTGTPVLSISSADLNLSALSSVSDVSLVLADSTATVLATTGATLAAVPTTTVEDSYVKATSNVDATTYSVVAKTVVTVSVGANVSLTINGNAVANGDTFKFIPGDTFTYAATPAANYTATVAVTGGTDNDGTVTVGETAITVAATATLDTYIITIPSVANTTVSVSYTSGGEDRVATAAGDISVDYGTSLTATWTAVSGYQITANAEQTINPVVETQTLTPPTVEAVSQEATVSNVSFSPSANGKATVTATITGPAMTATLTYGESQYNANVVNGSVTFENVSVGQTSDSYFAPTEYSLTTDAGQTTGQTSGLVDGTSWINENATTHVGGAWTNDVSYVNNKATIKDNRFEATSAAPTAAGGLVVLTMNVNFPTFSDAMVDGDAQGAITLREVNDTPTFSVLTTNENGKVWTDVTGAGSVNTNIDYVITLTFNYAANKYTAAVGGTTLSAAGGVSEFDILKNASSVQNIDFVGEGVLEYLKGDVAAEGAMVEDVQHNKYATVDAAIAAYNADKTIGQLTMLHPGSVPSGWKVVNGIISKIIKGWKLIAY